ncbi:MAG TPA: alpha/beta fold hydrolase [Terriglobales bacterium]|jgi:medium-chain acyl-[acyl-carrier-protein] hydrolase|nr:alpha/beta fold hydrolase [Terriglobales bacterium]
MASTSTRVQTNNWIHSPKPNPEGRLRLVCIPYAGGGGQVFNPWPALLPAEVELFAVNLPGRGRRLLEPPIAELSKLIELLAPQLPCDDKPFVLFGHSMGALVSFELARELRRRHRAAPLHLFASGCFPPHVPDPHPIHTLPGPEFIQEVRDLNGIPKEVQENQELMDLMLPVLKADFTLTETYVHRPEPPLACPITVYGGATDPLSGDRDIMEGWRQHTSGKFSLQMLPGDHFFLQSAQRLLLTLISWELKEIIHRLGASPA